MNMCYQGIILYHSCVTAPPVQFVMVDVHEEIQLFLMFMCHICLMVELTVDLQGTPPAWLHQHLALLCSAPLCLLMCR